nr:MAG TPA: hypothetical protein [Caudoviricetes sp.]
MMTPAELRVQNKRSATIKKRLILNEKLKGLLLVRIEYY